ncbi:MAG: hypothetical protein JWP51_3629 [Bradyrhizobium sp.]|jgi:hypothetical protein|nr:hypothetical protein [Bradyrhizobium sp.]
MGYRIATILTVIAMIFLPEFARSFPWYFALPLGVLGFGWLLYAQYSYEAAKRDQNSN